MDKCTQSKSRSQSLAIMLVELEEADQQFAATTVGAVLPILHVRILSNDRPKPLSTALKNLLAQA
jgi:hypothetical protein